MMCSVGPSAAGVEIHISSEEKVLGFSVGGVDFITKPFQREEVLSRINAHLTILRQRLLLQTQNNRLTDLNHQLQAQIDKLGQYNFQDGSRVLGGKATLNINYDYIKLEDDSSDLNSSR